jgi:hypothetical protein
VMIVVLYPVVQQFSELFREGQGGVAVGMAVMMVVTLMVMIVIMVMRHPQTPAR